MTDHERRPADILLRRVLQMAAGFAVVLPAALFAVVLYLGLRPLFNAAGPGLPDFLSGFEWRPEQRELFGLLPLLSATFVTAVAAVIPAAVVAIPAGLFIVEQLPVEWNRRVQGFVELSAGIPGVVYGFVGLMVVVPALQNLPGFADGRSLAAAVIVLALMCLPTMLMFSIRAFAAVPVSYRWGARSLGASPLQTAWRVVYPAARRQIGAGMLLSSIRAGGEAAAVVMVAGNSPQVPAALSDSIRTMTGTILLEMGSAEGVHSDMLFTVGLLLCVMVLAGQWYASYLGNPKGRIW